MPEPQPLVWWCDAALDAVASEIDPVWRQWCRDWGLVPAAARAANAHEARDETSGMAWQSSPGRRSVSLALAGGAVNDSGLRSLLFAIHGHAAATPPSQPLACAVAEAAWSDLQRTVEAFVEAAGSADAAHRESPADPWRAWSGALLLRLPFASAVRSGEALALFDGTLARQRFPSPKRGPVEPDPSLRVPLVAMRDALAAKTVEVRVELDGFEIDFGSLATLAVGDVVVPGHRLEGGLRLTHGDDDAGERLAICWALLGRRLRQRAVALVA